MFRRMFSLSLLAGTLALTGCAQPLYHKPGVTEQQWLSERYVCEREARQTVPERYGLANGLSDAITRQRLFDSCLHASGYRRTN